MASKHSYRHAPGTTPVVSAVSERLAAAIADAVDEQPMDL
jgi:hypothetical protein